MGESTVVQRKSFLLSFLAMRGFEHYDCIIKAAEKLLRQTPFISNHTQNKISAQPSGSPSVFSRKSADYKSPEKKKISRKKQIQANG